MTCAEIRELLPAHVRGEEASLGVRRHLSRCADCRAELARYEEILTGLSTLKASTAEPPPGLVEALVAIPSNAGVVESFRGHVARNRRAYLGGAAIVVAGAAGRALWRARTHRLAAA